MQRMPGVAAMYAARARDALRMSQTPTAIEQDGTPLHPPNVHRSDDTAVVDQHEQQLLGGIW